MLVEVTHNGIVYHLEIWNRIAVEEAGLSYEVVPIRNDRDYTLSNLEDIIQ
jgi:extradiol dioxygenase family protein